MATLSITETRDYRKEDLSGIDLIDFDNPFLSTATATFALSQFDDVQIDFDAEIRGNIGVNGLVLVGDNVSTGDFNITHWNAADTITLQGTNGGNYLVGSVFNETLNGGLGDDLLEGSNEVGALTGSDVYNGGGGSDTLINDFDAKADRLSGGGGSDWLVYRSQGFFQNPDGIYDLTLDISDGGGGRDIGNGTIVSGIERVTLLFATDGAVDFIGGALNDTVTSGKQDDTLDGRGGQDILAGNWGNDVISGGAGGDTIVGGYHSDTLAGGPGTDLFEYDSVNDSTLAFFDTINGFISGEDKIDLRIIDADEGDVADDDFTFIGSAAFSGEAGELRVVRSGGLLGFTTIRADTDGDTFTDFYIRLSFKPIVQKDDFFL